MSNESEKKESRNDVELNECRRRARTTFWKVLMDGTWKFIDQAPAIWSGPEGRFYRYEKRIVSRHVEPIYWGAFVSLFLFVTFRVSGSRIYSRFRDNFFPKTQTANSTNTKSNYSQTQWKSYLNQRAETIKDDRQDLLELPTDIFVSLVCGCSSILLLSKPRQMKHDLIEAPLYPGKSVVTDIFCPAIETAFHDVVDPRIINKDTMESDDTVSTFLALVKNCRIRAEYIAYQQEQGAVKHPDVIPYPGLDGVRR